MSHNKMLGKAPPLVTVVIPLYNQEAFIASAVQSALNQNYPSIEVIIVNDGSQDESLKICQGILDSRIRIITQENTGLSGARNTGIRAARGKYIALLDADDLWLPGKISEHVDLLETYPEVGISYNYSLAVGEGNKRVLGYQMMGYGFVSPDELFKKNPMGNGSSPVVRASVFDMTHPFNQRSKFSNNYFDKEYPCVEDYDLWARIALHTDWKIVAIPVALTRYRIVQSSLSNNLHRQKHYHLRAIAKIAEYFPQSMKKYRCRNVSNFYWYQAGRSYFHLNNSDGLKFIRSAIWYDPFNLGPRQAFSCFAYMSKICFPTKLHSIFESAALYLHTHLQAVAIFFLQCLYRFNLWRRKRSQE
jgi:glycosyltransferase involved in cell wall biosynthesis